MCPSDVALCVWHFGPVLTVGGVSLVYFKPTWNKIANLFADEANVKIVSVDADEHRSLGEKYEVQGTE